MHTVTVDMQHFSLLFAGRRASKLTQKREKHAHQKSKLSFMRQYSKQTPAFIV
jgi:hypothetical protein